VPSFSEFMAMSEEELLPFRKRRHERLGREIEEMEGALGVSRTEPDTSAGSLEPGALRSRDDVDLAVAKLARPLAKEKGISGPAARVEVWRNLPTLRKLREELPESPAPVQGPPAEPGSGSPTEIRKGESVLRKHSAEVERLRKSHPEKTSAELRVMAWKENPHLRDEYERALTS